MSLATILLAVAGLVGAILGAFLGHARGKSVGKVEGAEQAQAQQQITQAKATVQAVRERAHVDAKISDASDADLDQRLSKYDRPD